MINYIATLSADRLLFGAIAVLVLALLCKRIYDCYIFADLRTGEENRKMDVLKLRSLLAGHASVFAISLGLFFELSLQAMLWSVVGSAVVMILPAAYIYLKSNWALDDVQKAINHTCVAHFSFDKFIHTGGDLIGRKDLKITIEQGPQLGKVSPSDIIVAEYLLANFEDIGHVISKSSKKGLMPSGVPGGMYSTKRTVRIYGISKEDLMVYPEIVCKRNARWLGKDTLQ